jgi:hypothetical protein
MHYERVGQGSLAGAKIQLHTDNSYMQPSPPHAIHPSPILQEFNSGLWIT